MTKQNPEIPPDKYVFDGFESAPATTQPEESKAAVLAAAYAKDMVRQIISNGRPEPQTFMDLCAALIDLEMVIPVGPNCRPDDFHGRAEEIDIGIREGFRCQSRNTDPPVCCKKAEGHSGNHKCDETEWQG